MHLLALLEPVTRGLLGFLLLLVVCHVVCLNLPARRQRVRAAREKARADLDATLRTKLHEAVQKFKPAGWDSAGDFFWAVDRQLGQRWACTYLFRESHIIELQVKPNGCYNVVSVHS